MIKKVTHISLVIIILVFLSSCSGKVDVDKLAIASSIGIDKSEKGYKVSVQIVNTGQMKEGSTSTLPMVVTHSVEAKTVAEAISKLSTKFSGRVFMAHFDILFIGEDLAKEGILGIIVDIYADNEPRHKYIVAIVKGGTAEDILKIRTSINKIPAVEINHMIKAVEKSYGIATTYHMDEILTSIKLKGKNPILSSVEIIGDKEKGTENKNIETLDIETYVKFSNLAVFKDDKLVGYLSKEGCLGYSHLIDNITGSVHSVEVNDDFIIAFEIGTTKTKKDLKIVENKPSFNITHNASGTVLSVSTAQSELSQKEKKQIEKALSDLIKLHIEKYFEKTKEYSSDPVGFGEIIHRKELEYWKSIEDEYHDMYKNIEFKITANVSLIDEGY